MRASALIGGSSGSQRGGGGGEGVAGAGGSPIFFRGAWSPVASLLRALILFYCRAGSPRNVCCGARALFVVCWESERR